MIKENSEVMERAVIFGNALVRENARICGTAILCGDAFAEGADVIDSGIWVSGRACLLGATNGTAV